MQTSTPVISASNPRKTRMAAAVAVCALFLTTLLFTSSAFSVPAFPGAEGQGAGSVGGRGGHVYKVTSLADSGAGTFREAVSSAGPTGPRTVVFTIAGIIVLQSPVITTRSFLTIAGQTAPGGGIQLRGNMISFTNANNIIVRYIRHRAGGSTAATQLKGFETIGPNSVANNIIVDHCSFGWQTDDNSTWYNTNKITYQRCIFAEANSRLGGFNGVQGRGWLLGTPAGQGAKMGTISLHHNFITSNYMRNPLIAGDGPTEFVSNVIYNWAAFGTSIQTRSTGGAKLNVIGNFYKKGPSSTNSRYEFLLSEAGGDAMTQPPGLVYVNDNLGPHRTSGTQPQWAFVGLYPGPQSGNSAASTSFQRGSPWPTSANPISVSGAQANVTNVLNDVGATILLNADGTFRNARDAVDTRLVNEYNNGTGSIGGDNNWPVLATTPAAYADTDNDGMADAWEIAKFGNITAKNNNSVAANGYTELENFLNRR